MPSKRNNSTIDVDGKAAESDKATPKKNRRARGRRQGESLTTDEIAAAKGAFLTTYGKYGTVGKACDVAGIHRATVYRWLEHDEAFSLQYHQAREEYNDLLRSEIRRRAHDGTLKPVYQGGVKVGSIREYSDTLLIFEAKARMPEYRDKVDVSAQIQASVTHDLNLAVDANAAALANAFLRHITAPRTSESGGPGVSGK